jgi:hypothetical protein
LIHFQINVISFHNKIFFNFFIPCSYFLFKQTFYQVASFLQQQLLMWQNMNMGMNELNIIVFLCSMYMYSTHDTKRNETKKD